MSAPIELLAPAKNFDCAVAAIDAGADAVYMGAPAYGARENAGNSVEDIAAVCRYAHKYFAKVYATVNTLLRDEEVDDAAKLIYDLTAAGVDGIIVQDLALLERALPDVPLIASTQMHNTTPERVAFLGKCGVKRAILARELSLEEIKAIREATDIELEFFVHGALCVSYSGRCYLSYAIGGRSGNRGCCAQPCRNKYSLVNEAGREIIPGKHHYLSLKDLNLSARLEDLLDAGVTSFKIEGRLKDEAYVRNVTAYYRKALDKIIAKRGLKRASSGVTVTDFEPNLAKTFNRGYCEYFLDGRKERIGSLVTPKMRGEFIGRVTSGGKLGFRVDKDASYLKGGDGICFITKDGRVTGTFCNGYKNGLILADKTGRLDPGTAVYRNSDSEFLKKLTASETKRLIPVTLLFDETDAGFALTAEDCDGIKAEVRVDREKSEANNPERAAETIEKNLTKTGGTVFTCEKFENRCGKPYFFPISELNGLRREVLEKLEANREKAYKPERLPRRKDNSPYPESELNFEGNIINDSAKRFVMKHGAKVAEPGAEGGADLTGRRVMTTRYCLRHQLNMCPKTSDKPYTGKMFLVNDNVRLELEFDCKECKMNVILRE